MTSPTIVTEVKATESPERTEREVVRPWHELDYALRVADSDRILADALTPQSVVLLHRVATERSGWSHPSASAGSGWTVTAPPAPEIRATQRSPPRGCEPAGRRRDRPSNTRW